jgi:PAS domain S-box-containing protein
MIGLKPMNQPAELRPAPPAGDASPVALDGLLRVLAEQWPGVVLLFDAADRLIWCNDQAARWQPAAAAQNMGAPAERLFARWRLGPHWTEFRRGSTTVLQPSVALHDARDGSTHKVRLRVQPLLLHGASVATLCVIEPLLDNPPVLAAIAPNVLQRMESVFRVARCGLWEWDVAAEEVKLSPGFYRLIGLDALADPEPAATFKERCHPDDASTLREDAIARLNGLNEIFEREFRLRHADGHWVWVLDRGCVTARDAQGRVAVVSGLIVDITARRAAEAALRDSEARFRIATEIAKGIIYEVDLADDVAMRHGIERLTGYPPHSINPSLEGWLSLVVVEDRGRVRDYIMASRRTGTRYECEYRLRRRDGRIIHLWHRGGFIFDAQGRPCRSFGFAEDVSARVEAQQALQASEFRFRAVAELTAGYVFEVRRNPDGTGSMVFASDSFATVMGGTRAEFERSGGWRNFCDAESMANFVAACKLLNSGMPADTELHGSNLRGEEKWLRMRSTPVIDPLTGVPVGDIGAATDITEAKRAELALRRSQSVLQTIAEGSAAQLALFDLQGRCIFINRSLIGLDRQQMVGAGIETIVELGGSSPARALLEQVIATRQGVDVERTLTDPRSGELRLIELRLRPVMSTSRVVAVVTNITDVTEIHRQQEDLRLQARIIETLREGVAVFDANGHVGLSNTAFDRMFGYAPGSLVGRFGGELSPLPPAQYEKLRQRIQEQLDNDVAPIEFEGLRKDGSRFTAAAAFARIEVGGQRCVVAVLSDVTEHKQMEREILQIANREQQRIGSDLHDGLGQDLTGVALLLRGLAARIARATDAPLRETLEPDVEQIIALVNDAIDSTRSLARGLSPVSAERDGLVLGLEALVSQTTERYGLDVVLRQDVAQNIGEHPLIDDASATHLYRIAQEAVVNAVRHGKARRIVIALHASTESIDLSIQDNGSGFAVRAAPGAGMGLKIMRYRARILGGEVRFERGDPQGVNPGTNQGTRIVCECPLEPAADASRPRRPRRRAS